ncbi:hypothetical protein ACLOJK_013123 [Asimina triloba]
MPAPLIVANLSISILAQKRNIQNLVTLGHRHLLRIINAVMDEELFFAIAQHQLTVVGTDGSYTKPLASDYVMSAPGQTIDVLLEANQQPKAYLMASAPYSSAIGAGFDKTTTTAILQYDGWLPNPNPSPPPLPTLPLYNDTQAAANFTEGLSSLANEQHPVQVLLDRDFHFFFTVSVNLLKCTDKPCKGPFGMRYAASMNNIIFVSPQSMDILRAYYYSIQGIYGQDFPSYPAETFNYTGQNLPMSVLATDLGIRVKVLEYDASVEMV